MSDDLKKLVLEKRKEGKIVFFALEDILCSADVKEFIKQPTDGILWDLNRLEEVALSRTHKPRWVNDFAVALTIRALKQSVERLEEDYVMLQKGLCGTNAELVTAWDKIEQLKRVIDVARKLAEVERNQYETCYVPEIKPYLEELDKIFKKEKEDARA